jgi:hypothetical protein
MTQKPLAAAMGMPRAIIMQAFAGFRRAPLRGYTSM